MPLPHRSPSEMQRQYLERAQHLHKKDAKSRSRRRASSPGPDVYPWEMKIAPLVPWWQSPDDFSALPLGDGEFGGHHAGGERRASKDPKVLEREAALAAAAVKLEAITAAKEEKARIRAREQEIEADIEEAGRAAGRVVLEATTPNTSEQLTEIRLVDPASPLPRPTTPGLSRACLAPSPSSPTPSPSNPMTQACAS